MGIFIEPTKKKVFLVASSIAIIKNQKKKIQQRSNARHLEQALYAYRYISQ